MNPIVAIWIAITTSTVQVFPSKTLACELWKVEGGTVAVINISAVAACPSWNGEGYDCNPRPYLAPSPCIWRKEERSENVTPAGWR